MRMRVVVMVAVLVEEDVSVGERRCRCCWKRILLVVLEVCGLRGW